jgi:DNA-directed RNA polymerase subunit M/transcription elongation factor TFIIS
MAKCPKCGRNGTPVKRWIYGPKTRVGQTFDVTIYECTSGHRWREYKKKDMTPQHKH